MSGATHMPSRGAQAFFSRIACAVGTTLKTVIVAVKCLIEDGKCPKKWERARRPRRTLTHQCPSGSSVLAPPHVHTAARRAAASPRPPPLRSSRPSRSGYPSSSAASRRALLAPLSCPDAPLSPSPFQPRAAPVAAALTPRRARATRTHAPRLAAST